MAHKLKTGRRTETPNRFLFFDTETRARCVVCGAWAKYTTYPTDPRCPKCENGGKEFENVFRLGEACYWSRKRKGHPETIQWHTLRNADAMWVLIDHLSRPRQGLCIVAHNIAFDTQVVGGLSALGKRGWRITNAIVDDPPFILKARRGSSSLLFLDWYNYFRGSLAAAGSLLDVPKLPMPALAASDEEWSTYCRNDVLVLLAAMQRYIAFLHEYDLGTFAHTLAGQSLSSFTHRFMKHDIYIHIRKDAIRVEREGYYGGRVEMFRRNVLPAQTYTYCDINSAYPAVMRDGLYPVSFEGVERNVSVRRLEKYLTTHLLMAQVVVRTKRPLFPLRVEGRLIFPIGEFSTTLATPELAIAIQRGLVVRCPLLVKYNGERIFTQFVDEMYELRRDAKEKGDAFWDELLKRLMNSLYGKFGQHQYEWTEMGYQHGKEDIIWRELDKDTGRVRTFRRLGGVLSERTKQEEGFNSFVAIAAHATSAARTLLLRYIEAAGWDHVYYCDTDSLITDEQGTNGLASFFHPTKLGALKVERKASNVKLLAPKNYTFGDHVRHKGRRESAKALPDHRYEQDQFVSLVGALRMGWNGGPLVRRVIKHDRLTYKKGIIQDDDTISPITLFTP